MKLLIKILNINENMKLLIKILNINRNMKLLIKILNINENMKYQIFLYIGRIIDSDLLSVSKKYILFLLYFKNKSVYHIDTRANA